MIRKLAIVGAMIFSVSPAFAEEIRKADLDQFLIVQSKVAPVAHKWKEKIAAAPEGEKDGLRIQAWRDVESTIKRGGMKPETYFATAKIVEKQAAVAKEKQTQGHGVKR
jgi:hypothetical protein